MISASVIERAGGFGFGGGSGSDPGKGDSGVGGGGGGGGTAMARPVAIIEVTPDGSVTVSPVIDFTPAPAYRPRHVHPSLEGGSALAALAPRSPQ